MIQFQSHRNTSVLWFFSSFENGKKQWLQFALNLKKIFRVKKNLVCDHSKIYKCLIWAKLKFHLFWLDTGSVTVSSALRPSLLLPSLYLTHDRGLAVNYTHSCNKLYLCRHFSYHSFFLVIMLVRNNPEKWWIDGCEYMKIIYVNCGLRAEIECDLCSNENHSSSSENKA